VSWRDVPAQTQAHPAVSNRVMGRLLVTVAIVGTALCGITISARRVNAQQGTPPSLTTIVAALDEERTAWVATARLRTAGPGAVSLLLDAVPVQAGRPPRYQSSWTPAVLALAKIGVPAIPAISERLARVALESGTQFEAQALVRALGAIGPEAIPALVEAASRTNFSPTRLSALERIVELEPRHVVFGQLFGPWSVWRAAEDRTPEIQRTLAPLLPRVLELLNRDMAAWRPGSVAPERPAAYLLARWGGGAIRARGLEFSMPISGARISTRQSPDPMSVLANRCTGEGRVWDCTDHPAVPPL